MLLSEHFTSTILDKIWWTFPAQAFLVKCDSGITPLNKTAAYDVEVHYDPINDKYGVNDKLFINTLMNLDI